MKKKLFLIGPDRSGKSDMIQSALGEHIRHAGGFVTIRERDAQGNVRSFDLMSADGSGQPERFWELVNGKPMSHMEVFAQRGTRLLNQAEGRPFALLDELGGVELLDDAFVRALVQLLKSGTPCIGVLRGPGAGRVVGLMGLNLRYELARRVLVEHLKKDPHVELVHTTGLGDEKTMALVRAWVDEYAK